MVSIIEKFAMLATDNAPGQEVRQTAGNISELMRGGKLPGRPVDFSHRDVDAFTPTPGAFDRFSEAVRPIPNIAGRPTSVPNWRNGLQRLQGRSSLRTRGSS